MKFLVSVALAAVVAGCVTPTAPPLPVPSQGSCWQGEVGVVPMEAVAGAWAHVEPRMARHMPEGTTFVLCTESGRYDPSEACLAGGCTQLATRPHFWVVFSFAVPAAPWVAGTVSVAMDLNGTAVLAAEGVVDCGRDAAECRFPVDEDDALAIARVHGLEEGIEPWRTSFHHYDGNGWNYVWSVENTLERFGDGFSGSGRVLLIDGNDGSVLEAAGWTAEA